MRERTDRNEAMRLAEWIEDDMSCQGDAEVAAMLRQQAERIAELEAAQAGLTHDEDGFVIDRMGKLLAETVLILRGQPPELTRWSYHDIPERVAALTTERDQLRAELALRPWRPISPARIAALWSEACKPDRPTCDMVEAFVRLIEADHGLDVARTTHKETE